MFVPPFLPRVLLKRSYLQEEIDSHTTVFLLHICDINHSLPKEHLERAKTLRIGRDLEDFPP